MSSSAKLDVFPFVLAIIISICSTLVLGKTLWSTSEVKIKVLDISTVTDASDVGKITPKEINIAIKEVIEAYKSDGYIVLGASAIYGTPAAHLLIQRQEVLDRLPKRGEP